MTVPAPHRALLRSAVSARLADDAHLPSGAMGSHDMRVDLRGSDIGVAKHHLYTSQIRASLQQMRRKRMPQNVRAQFAITCPTAFPAPRKSFQKPCRVIRVPRAVTNRYGLTRPFNKATRCPWQ